MCVCVVSHPVFAWIAQDAVRRSAVGVWKCRGCRKIMAGGAWTLSTSAAVAVRSNIRRLREAQVL